MAQVFGEKSNYLIKKDKHYYGVALVALFLLFFILALYLKIIGSYSFNSSGALVIIFVFLGLFFLIKKFSEKNLSISNKFSKGRSGEYEICDELQKLPDSNFIFRNLKINNFGDIDLIIIGPTGIFTVEVKSHKGKIDFSGEKLTINGKIWEKNFLGQAMSEALSLKDYLTKNGINNIFVEPVVVFSSKYASVRFGFNKIKSVYVIQKGFLNNLILNNKSYLSPENIDSMKNILMKIVKNK